MPPVLSETNFHNSCYKNHLLFNNKKYARSTETKHNRKCCPIKHQRSAEWVFKNQQQAMNRSFTSVPKIQRTGIIKRQTIEVLVRMQKNRNLYSTGGNIKPSGHFANETGRPSKRLKIELPDDTATPLLVGYVRALKTCPHEICT